MITIRKWNWFSLLFIAFFLLPMGYGNLFAQGPSKEKMETKVEGASAPVETKKNSKELLYTAIAEKNLFNPERKEFPLMIQTGTGGEIRKPIVRPQIILYGVTITENYQSATLSNPGGSLQKGGKEIVTLRAGEKLGEYKVAKVLPDRVVMELGEDSFEVLLYDPKNPKKRTFVRTEVKPATVATAASQTSSVPAAPVSGTPPPEKVAPASPPVPTTPTYPLRPGRGRTTVPPSQGLPTPTPPSEVAPLTPITPTPIAPPTSVPVPMTPRSIPVSPPTPIPVTPGGPTPQGSGGQ